MMPGKYTVFGSDPSYFTCKVLAMFGYMDIAHDYRYRSQDKAEAFEARAGTRMVPVVETPEKWVIWDSTPIGELLCARYPTRSIVPTTPVQKVATKILEDFIDEWLPRQALYFRWIAGEGLDRSALEIAANGFLGRAYDDSLSDEEEKTVQMVAGNIKETFGMRVCKVAACGEEQGEELVERFTHLLNLLAEHRKANTYFFGERASLADLALVGGSYAHFVRDQASMDLVAKVDPEFATWTNTAWDSKLGTETFLEGDVLPDTLMPIFEEIASHYHVYLRANHQVLLEGGKTVKFNYGYGPTERRAYRYSELSRQDIKSTLEDLSGDERQAVEAALGKTGVLDIYDLEPIECGYGSVAKGLT